jgi:hypothetical protein
MKSATESAVTAKSATESPSIPRAHSDEQAVHEVIRSPVSVRRTSIRIVAEVAVRANRWRAVGVIVSVVAVVVVLRLHASHRSNKEQRPQQRKIF